jgi:formate/nitrite transporter FocA (FNT family)
MTTSTKSTFSLLYSAVRRLINPYIYAMKLRAAQRVTLLLSALVFYAVVVCLSLGCLLFASIGVGHLLATTIAPHVAYLIVAAAYAVVLLMVCLFRKQLFVHPIARIIAKSVA